MGLFDDIPAAEGGGGDGGPLRITVRPRREAPAIDPRARDLAIRTIYGEAANEPDEGKAAVAAVIRNRAQAGRYGGSDVPSVVMAPNQFEPWNRADARNRMLALKPGTPDYERIGQIVDRVFSGEMPDPTGGMTHFYAPEAQAALGRMPPGWAKGESLPIGRHTFFAPEGRVGATDVSAQARPEQAAPQAGGLFDDIPAAPQRAPGAPSVATAAGQSAPAYNEGQALVRGGMRGVTGNFWEELLAIGKAGERTPEELAIVNDRLAKMGIQPEQAGEYQSALVGLWRYLKGDPQAVQKFDAALQSENKITADMRAQNPGSMLTGEIGGAVALPTGKLLQAATVPARVGRSALVGAGYGATAGAGDGEGAADRATRAASGGAMGGVVGAAAVPALAGVELAGRGIARMAEPMVNSLRGAAGVEREASRRVAGALDRDIRAGDSALTPQQVVAARNTGQPVTIADWGGENTRALARDAANTSGEGRAVLQNIADDRFEGQTDRATTFIRNLFGGKADPGAERASLKATARVENSPAYRAAYSHPNAQGMWDEGFEQISQAPVVQSAIRAASVTAANRGTMEGFPRIASPFTIDKATGQLTLRTNPDGSRVLPNLQFWDHVKRNLDKINTPEARALNDALKGHLDDLVPLYKDARAGAAKFFDAEDALTAGTKFVHQNMALQDARRALSAMSAEEREMFRQGFAAKLLDDIGRVGDRQDLLKRIATSPEAKQKLELVLGPQGWRKLETFLAVEGAMNKLREAVKGNSTTVRQLYNLGIAGGAGYGAYNYNDPASAAYGIATAILSARGKKVDERIARKVAELLTSSDPNVLARGIQQISTNPAIVRALRSADARLSAVGAQQAPAPAIQLPGAGRAEEE